VTAASQVERFAPRDLVVIGASAGGVQTLRRVVADLPADLPATVCIVLHIAPNAPSMLASIARAGPLPSRAAFEALYAEMPAAALAQVAVDAVVPSEQVAQTIVAMVTGEDPPPAAPQNDRRVDPTAGELRAAVRSECGGVLSERVEAGVRRAEAGAMAAGGGSR
jgi:CheB methylesterase